MLEDFLSKLGASTKITIGVSVSPTAGLEMIEVDRATQTVSRYSNRPLDYNHSSREIVDYGQFETALTELFDELHIPVRSNIILNLPNVHFGMIKLPILLSDEGINNAIISEVEQSYIFKRQEPVVSWSEVITASDSEMRTLIYSAIQKSTLDKILEVCNNVGCTLIGIENSYSSLLKTLHFSNVAEEQMKENISWNMMLIGQNSYSILSMYGKKIIEYYEEPLALKSFEDDEIYNAIASSAQLTLTGLTANYLYIISETDLVSAEVLSMKINTDSAVKFLECNKFTQKELLPINLNILPQKSLQITPEAIGVGIYLFSDYPLKLNILKEAEGLAKGEESSESPKINIGNLEIELTPAFLKRVFFLMAGILVLPLILLALLLSNVVIPKEQSKLDDINNNVKTLNEQISKYKEAEKGNTFNVNASIEKILSQNTTKLAYYSALGLSIPNNLWVTHYMMNGDKKINISGKSKDVKSIYTFYKNLKELVNNSDIRLYKLEIPSSSLDDVVMYTASPNAYNFEITNMSDDELNPQPSTADNKDQQNQKNTQNQKDQKTDTQSQIFTFSKSLFNSSTSTDINKALPAQPLQQSNNAGAPNNTTNQAQQSPSPQQGNGNNLPPNLKKIEKF